MSTAGNWFRFLWTCWKLNLAGAMEFRMSFLLTAGMMIVNDLVWILFWGIYFAKFSGVNGWEFRDVAMMWSIAAGGAGIVGTFFGNANRLSGLISTGQLDAYLVQPKPVLLHVLVSRMSVASIGDILFSLLLYGYSGELTIAGFAKYMLGLAITAMIFLFFAVAVHSLSFYIGNAEGLAVQLYNSILAFATYPTDIFRGWGRILLFTAIPAGFISFMPLGLLKETQVPFLLGAFGAALLSTAGGIAFFYRGLRRYSSGNKMTLRM